MVVSVGIGVDYARAVLARADLQAAIDAAVVAGAKDATTGWSTIATGVFQAQGLDRVFTLTDLAFSQNTSGNYVGTASATIPATVTGLIGSTGMDVTVTSTAVVKTSTDPVCILLLGASTSPGLLLNSGASINAPNCQVHVKSTGSPAATFNSGTTLSTKKVCVAGSSVIDNGGTHPNLTKSCTVATDPFAGTLPTPASSTCTYSNVSINGGTATAYPGVYCGWFNLNSAPTVNFQPGVYVIKGGGVNVNGGVWNGTGVTFYFPDTSYIQFNGTTTVNISAPTSGSYAGLLMYEAAGLAKSSFSLAMSGGATLKGLIYLPSRAVTLNSGTTAISETLTMVLDSLTVNQVNWSMDTSDKVVSATGTAAAGVYLSK